MYSKLKESLIVFLARSSIFDAQMSRIPGKCRHRFSEKFKKRHFDVSSRFLAASKICRQKMRSDVALMSFKSRFDVVLMPF